MTDSNEEIAGQIHRWPWSVEIDEESDDLRGKNIDFPFYGSPVVSVAADAKLFLPTRHEQFSPLGPSYQFNGDYQVYETPHGVLSGVKNSNNNKLILSSKKGREEFYFQSKGGVPQNEILAGKQQQSTMAKHVLAWSQFFDDLLKDAVKGDQSDGIQWDTVLDRLNDISESQEPRMALIVRIAEDMDKKLFKKVAEMRRILLRQRESVAVYRIQEIDTACLRWYIQQPGRTMAEKAGQKQRLLAVIRREVFDTLENRVMKDFILRCRDEGSRYLKEEVGDSKVMKNSNRVRSIRNYREICVSCLKEPVFENISQLTTRVQPNYVLQNDSRYKEVWDWYQKLLKHEDETDRLWDWQTRTWSDVMRLLIGVAFELGIDPPGSITPLIQAPLRIRREQHLGCRIIPGSEPGPFLLTQEKAGAIKRKILEIVHPDLAAQHPVTQLLGKTGGHLYLVIRPTNESEDKEKVIICWSVNGAGTTHSLSSQAIAQSARSALETHKIHLGRRKSNFPELRGMVVMSQERSKKAEKIGGKIPVVCAPADVRGWESAVEEIALALSEILGEML